MKKKKNSLLRLLDFLGSFGLAAALLIMLCVLTLFGTLEQQYSVIEDVQNNYFESLFVVHQWGGKFPIPWPGGLLLLGLLGVNLLIGGLIRLRMGRSTIGVFIVHLGMVVLLFGSLIEHSLSTRGFLRVAEGQTSEEYVSYEEWELAIAEGAGRTPERLYLIDEGMLRDAEGEDRVRFEHEGLPFDVVLTGYSRNAEVEPAGTGEAGATVVDGYALRALEPVSRADKEEKNRMNLPGVVAILENRATNERLPAIVWPGPSAVPFTVTVGDTRYQVDFRRKRWVLPFTIRLDRFVHETHPGTRMDRRFSSYVTKAEGGVEREVHITMNEPLRHEGYTLYQSSWGRDGGRYFSVFSVVANPSDRVPLIACIIISIGMILHFGRKLYYHLKAQARRDARLRQDVPAGSRS